MSSFNCETCGAMCTDTRQGYITGCEHYPVNPAELRRWMIVCLKTSPIGTMKRVAESNGLSSRVQQAIMIAESRIADAYVAVIEEVGIQTATGHAQ